MSERKERQGFYWVDRWIPDGQEAETDYHKSLLEANKGAYERFLLGVPVEEISPLTDAEFKALMKRGEKSAP